MGKRMIFKRAALLVCALLLCFSMTACGDTYHIDIYAEPKQDSQDFNQDYDWEDMSPDYEEDPWLPLGSIYTFGSYPQSGTQDPIEWIVLDCKDGDALLLSRYALDSVSYHNQAVDVTWETSAIRQWLNSTFYYEAFSSAEREQILYSGCEPGDNSLYQVDGGNNTTDKVIMLSAWQATYYLPTDSDRLCKPTAYAVKQGAYQNPNTGGCWWWLSTPGYTQHDASSVNSDGSMDMDDGSVTSPRGTVRPAIWISLPR